LLYATSSAEDRADPASTANAVHREDLDPADQLRAVIDRIFSSDIQALRDTMEALDLTTLTRAADAIVAAERVEVCGIGSRGADRSLQLWHKRSIDPQRNE